MAEKSSVPSGHHQTSLQRGKACLRCRKRKMRCDGNKPACAQCVRAKKPEGCEYDDGKGKTRTQLMREHISRLEARIKELEMPEMTTSPPITLFDPHAPVYMSESSSPESHDSPSTLSLSASPSPFPLDMDSASWDSAQWGPMAIQDFPAMGSVTESYGSEDLPLELAQMLLDIFLPHRHQCGLELHIGRLRDSLTLPRSEQRHPVLMNAIYLWACYLSRPTSLSEHESLYLSRALAAVNDAISNPTKVVDFIQASCLLSMYFLSNGRFFEGSYYASVAANSAIQWGLHQIGSDDISPMSNVGESPFRLEPAKDSVEQGERILTFWQVFNLDRCWSVTLQRPATLPDSKHPWTAVSTPWPQRMDEYETGKLDVGHGSPTIQAFFAPQTQVPNIVGGVSPIALRVKASALFEGACRLSSSWSPRLQSSPTFTDSFRAIEHTITRFTTTLLPLHQFAATMPDDKYQLFVIHSLAHASMICLHEPFLDDQVSREVLDRAARSIVAVAKYISDADYDYLDPLIGHCWVAAARILTIDLAQLQATWPMANTTEIRGEIATLLYSLTKLSVRFPLLAYLANKVQKLLDASQLSQ